MFVVVDAGSFGKSGIVEPWDVASERYKQKSRLFEVAIDYQKKIEAYKKEIARIESGTESRAAKRALINAINKKNSFLLNDTAGELCQLTINKSKSAISKIFNILRQLSVPETDVAVKNDSINSEIMSIGRKILANVHYGRDNKEDLRKTMKNAEKGFEYIAFWTKNPDESRKMYNEDKTIFNGAVPDSSLLDFLATHNSMLINDILVNAMVKISDAFWKTDRNGQDEIYAAIQNGIPANGNISSMTASQFSDAFNVLDRLCDQIDDGTIAITKTKEGDNISSNEIDPNKTPEEEEKENREREEAEAERPENSDEEPTENGDPITPEVDKAMAEADPTAKRYGVELWSDDDNTEDTKEAEQQMIQVLLPPKSKVFRFRNDSPDDWNPMTVRDYAAEFVAYFRGVSIKGKIEE